MYKLHSQHYIFFITCELKRKSLLIVINSDRDCDILQLFTCIINRVNINVFTCDLFTDTCPFPVFFCTLFHKCNSNPNSDRRNSLKQVITDSLLNARQQVTLSNNPIDSSICIYHATLSVAR